MPVPDTDKVDHLFLLVGENPLPNYIAARMLLADAGSLYLVCTQRTKQQTRQLRIVLNPQGTPAPIPIKDIVLNKPEAYPQEIYDGITNIAEDLKGKIGLHYTGGNKVMAVHAYRAVDSLDQSRQFSYLDPQRLSLCIENNDILTFFPVSDNVSLDTIFELHGLRPDPPYGKEPRFASLSNAIAQRIFDTPTETNQEAFLAVLNAEGLLDEENKVNVEELLRRGNFPTVDSAKDWKQEGSGHWLEDYVLQQVQQIPAHYAIHDAGIDFSIPIGKSKSKGHRDTFQLDVAFMRHHQLFAISCTTTSGDAGCKKKLLEAYIRARQLGGSEARVALVCGTGNPDKLKNQIRFSIIDPDKVEVFGYKDWPNLSNKIASWIDRLKEETT